jgi:hypothetical protein
MSQKSIFQLLIPLASTVVIFLLFWVLSFIIWIIGTILFEFFKLDFDSLNKILGVIYEFLRVNIFEYRNPQNYDVSVNTVVYWILNVITIIIGELWATNEDFD